MMKVLAAVAALGLATPGIATAQSLFEFESELIRSCLRDHLLKKDPNICTIHYELGGSITYAIDS